MAKKESKLSRIINDRRQKGTKELSLEETRYLFAKYLRSVNKDMSYEESVRIAKTTAFRVQTKRDINNGRKAISKPKVEIPKFKK